MSVLAWNCRGAAHSDFMDTMADIYRQHSPMIIFILETRLPASRIERLKSLLRLESSHGVDSIGLSGGIWMLWDAARISVDILPHGRQAIHALVKVISIPKFNSFSWLLSGVYASSSLCDRTALWDEFGVIADCYSGPWSLIGDFNEIMNSSEKTGGRPPISNRMNLYYNAMNFCNLMDLGFTGPPFTWSNCRQGNGLIKERLDRAWANGNWKAIFPDSSLFHLARVHSDHCPLLLDLDFSAAIPKRKPFKLERFWMFHPEFRQIVAKYWNLVDLPVHSCNADFGVDIRKWAFSVFGNIFVRKNNIRKRLLGIESLPSDQVTFFHHRLYISLSGEFQSVLDLEKDLWFMKSRSSWLSDGDRNTKFFHITALKRRAHNRILGIRDSAGTWTYDIPSISDIILQYYKELFSSPHLKSFNDSFANLPGQEVPNASLPIDGFVPSTEEIYSALKTMSPFKAPGPDGIHAGFYLNHWDIVGHKLCLEIKGIFMARKMNPLWNHTILSLIPKHHSPEKVYDFRPIGLCNVTYKIVTKVIVKAIKQFMGDVISPNQSSFIAGRQGIDNVIILQEVVHHLHNTTNRKGGMIIKLDLEKAYDRLEWSFIREALIFFNIPSSLISLIMSCVSSSSIAVSVNGCITDSFLPSRGIRQGDPMSPYLFILCVEFLSIKICDANCDIFWKPCKIGGSGLKISHLFFADDLLFIGEATISNAMTLRSIMDFFSERSGQKINESKSAILFANNVAMTTRNAICGVLPFNNTDSLGSYLGIPISAKKIKKKDCSFIIEKLKSKLTSWKSKFLSSAGRIVLIKSVLNATSLYAGSAIFFPASIHLEIDKIVRNFLWGSSEDQRKMSMVKWKTVCLSQKAGGLGIKSSKEANIASMAKLQWRMYCNPSHLWVRVLSTRYKISSHLDFGSPRGSPSFRSICKGFDLFTLGTRWIPFNGNSIKFWSDSWVCNAPLRSILFGPWLPLDSEVLVSDCWWNGDWVLNNLSYHLPQSLIDILRSLNLSMVVSGIRSDRLVWIDSSSGDFSHGSAMSLLSGTPSVARSFDWIWKLHTYPKVKFLIWLIAHGRTPTAHNLSNRGIDISIVCPRCGLDVETDFHAFRDCPKISFIWNILRIPYMDQFIPDQTMFDWLRLNCTPKNNSFFSNIPWSCVFPFLIWNIWISRNHIVFKDNIWSPTDLISVTRAKAVEFWASCGTSPLVRLTNIVHVRWVPPPLNWVKLNTDGAAKSNPGISASGGVIRDFNGSWILGFYRNIGFSNSLVAELVALKDGLSLIIEHKFSHVIVESDSLVACNLISDLSMNAKHILFEFVDDCRKLLLRIPHVKLDHIFREANAVADRLSKVGLEAPPGIHLCPAAPPFCNQPLSADRLGISFPRSCKAARFRPPSLVAL